jgi:signal transduction histidine kinase
MAHGMRPPWDAVEEQVDDRVEQTLKVVMHEIRQPLAALFALAEAARSQPGLPAEARNLLTQIIEQAQEVAAASWSVLEPQVVAGGRRPGEVDAGEVVESVLDGFALTWTGSLTRSGDRDGLVVEGSRAALRRCLVNVLDNAVRAAGPSGRVAVTTRRTGPMVRILVEDDGPGFGHVAGRTGLGLRVTRQVLEAMGGELAVGPPSRAGGGSVALLLRAVAADVRGSDRPVRAV